MDDSNISIVVYHSKLIDIRKDLVDIIESTIQKKIKEEEDLQHIESYILDTQKQFASIRQKLVAKVEEDGIQLSGELAVTSDLTPEEEAAIDEDLKLAILQLKRTYAQAEIVKIKLEKSLLEDVSIISIFYF